MEIKFIAQIDIPKGTMLIVPDRRIDETDIEWLKRCVLVKNIKES